MRQQIHIPHGLVMPWHHQLIYVKLSDIFYLLTHFIVQLPHKFNGGQIPHPQQITNGPHFTSETYTCSQVIRSGCSTGPYSQKVKMVRKFS